VKRVSSGSAPARDTRAKAQYPLVAPLSAQINAAFTLIQACEATADPDHASHAMKKARNALLEVRRLSGQLEDSQDRKAIGEWADAVEGAITAKSEPNSLPSN
jgi:hypothetical protein